MANKFEQPKQPQEEFEKLEIVEEPEFEELEIIKEDLPEERAMEIFDPQEELAKIKKLPGEEKREALAEYKKKLAQQKEGIAGLQDRLISVIRKNPNIPLQELEDILEKESKKLKLTDEQEYIAWEILDKYQEKHEEVREIRGDYPNDIELFKKLFDKEPKGKIKVVEGPMTLYFRCYNLEDYALIHSEAFMDNRPLNEKDLEAANLTSGVNIPTALVHGLEGVIIAENVQKVAPESREQTLIHEEQHAIKSLFRDVAMRANIKLGLYKFETEEEVKLFGERLFRYWRKNAENRAKDELLAYIKSGESFDFTFRALTKTKEEGGIYDNLYKRRRSPKVY